MGKREVVYVTMMVVPMVDDIGDSGLDEFGGKRFGLYFVVESHEANEAQSTVAVQELIVGLEI